VGEEGMTKEQSKGKIGYLCRWIYGVDNSVGGADRIEVGSLDYIRLNLLYAWCLGKVLRDQEPFESVKK
jgi:hypothetical protein